MFVRHTHKNEFIPLLIRFRMCLSFFKVLLQIFLLLSFTRKAIKIFTIDNTSKAITIKINEFMPIFRLCLVCKQEFQLIKKSLVGKEVDKSRA